MKCFPCQAFPPTPLTNLYCCHHFVTVGLRSRWVGFTLSMQKPCHLYGAVPVFADELKYQSVEGGYWSILITDLERWFGIRSIYCSCIERWFSIKNTFCSCTEDPNLVLSNSIGLLKMALKSSSREIVQLWPLQAPALTPTSLIHKIKSVNNRKTREHVLTCVNSGCWFIQRWFLKLSPFSKILFFYNLFTSSNWAVTYWKAKPTNNIWIAFIMV